MDNSNKTTSNFELSLSSLGPLFGDNTAVRDLVQVSKHNIDC